MEADSDTDREVRAHAQIYARVTLRNAPLGSLLLLTSKECYQPAGERKPTYNFSAASRAAQKTAIGAVYISASLQCVQC